MAATLRHATCTPTVSLTRRLHTIRTVGLCSPSTETVSGASLPTAPPVGKPAKQVTRHDLPRQYFYPSRLLLNGQSGSDTSAQHQPPGQDGDKAKLGSTLRILRERLPTVLQSPLPQDILAPNISLHLFPTTHPHLPAVSGRVAYKAALWTSPIAWNRIPLVGNVKVEILSERMSREPLHFAPQRTGAIPEQLVVRWRTEDKSRAAGGSSTTSGSSGTSGGQDSSEEFVGLFIFQFDKEGKILSHTIEHAQESSGWERGVGAKVVDLTDRLLGGIKNGSEGSNQPAPAFQGVQKDKEQES